MGAVYNTIFQISPDDRRNLYVFTYGIQEWDDIYKWIEEKFLQLSTAFGVEGLFVMGTERPLDNELKEAYGKLNETINSITEVGSRGFIVTDVNPHKIQHVVAGTRPQVLFVPITNSSNRDELTTLVNKIIRAAKENDLSILQPLSLSLEANKRQSLLSLLASNLLLQPNLSGLGFDFGNFWKQLKKRP